MDRGNIFSGGAFRVTVYATSTLLTVFLLTGIVGYRYLQQAQYEHARNWAQPVIGMFQNLYAQGGDAAVAERVQHMAEWQDPASRLLSVYRESGDVIGGAFKLRIAPQSWHVRSIVTEEDSGQSSEYYLQSVKIGTHTFVVGEDLTPLVRIEAIFIRTLMIIGSFLAACFVALGYFASRSIQVKLEHMGRALRRFADGDTAIRLPVTTANDQIDRVAQTMNGQLERVSTLLFETQASATSIAHDLKRPLGRAVLSVERAFDAAERGEAPQAALEDVQAELSNLNAVFEAILRISRIDAGHGARLRDDIDLVALVKDLAETFEVVAEESGQSFKLVLPEGGTLFQRGDLGMLTQMLANLLQNAVNHGPPGNSICLALLDDPAGPILEVSDTGPGIPEADRTRIFDAFYRAELSRSTPGNGLGLTLVKSVADRHGARITISDNAPGLRLSVQFLRSAR